MATFSLPSFLVLEFTSMTGHHDIVHLMSRWCSSLLSELNSYPRYRIVSFGDATPPCLTPTSIKWLPKFSYQIAEIILNVLKISPNDDQSSIGLQIRDSIVTNLASNTFFLQNSDFKFEYFKNLYSLLVSTSMSIEKQHLAKLIFMLHLSKSDIDDRDEWSNLLQLFDSINFEELKEFEFADIIHGLFKQLKVNESITNLIEESVKEITAQNLLGFQLEEFLKNKLSLNLFNCEIVGLRGFAGIDSIYVNSVDLSSFFDKLSKPSIHRDTALGILKLEFIRIYIHEVTHVVVRKCLNDLNVSTPTIESKAKNINEAGVNSEEKLFGKRISWLSSVNYKFFNVKYCLEFLDDLLKGEKVEFDLDKSKCVENTNRIFSMAIDYEKPSFAQLEI
ncbi:hypothetical protein BpHYR1_026321 [Brachionus plicatilis]|uniref:Uncharacterized protein n=1 Tax=Brachionus plicatilis TaxID=10195 RepID=A0A3M7QRF0_BRAPC|nr:hypothetical protein BpHYR1_026321 [Brachionus plicatilis]